MDGTIRSNIRIGSNVRVVQKQDQRTGKLTEGDQAMDTNIETSAYLNSIMENYECDGQLSFFDIEKEEKTENDDRNRSNQE